MDKYIARALACIDRGSRIVHLEDDNRFDHDVSDLMIIQKLSEESPLPIFITADEAMKRNTDERKALAGSGMTIVFFKSGWHDLPFDDRAWMLMRLWRTLVKDTTRVRVATAFEVPASLRKLDRLYPTEHLKR